MREILFRGKSVANGEWIVGNYSAPLPTNWGATIEDAINFPNLIHTINPETVGQFTGLTDKNGKRIFEGDIVQGDNFWHKNLTKYQVAFDGGCFFLVDDGGRFWHKDHIENVEVIGNIYDNPELI